MSSLLAKLKKGKRNTKPINFPGTEDKVLLRVLSEQEQQNAMIAAERYLKEKEIVVSLSSTDLYLEEQSIQILYRALRSPDNQVAHFAASPDELRELISVAEGNFLIDLYREYELECSPDPMDMSQDEFDGLVTDIKKNCDQTLSLVSNIVVAKKLITILASPQ